MATLTTSYQLLGQTYIGSSGGSLYVRIYAKYSEQDIANNRTKVQYQARSYYENGTYILDQQGRIGVSGTSANYVGDDCTRPTTGETYSVTTEAWVYHNDDGSKSISASGSITFPNWGWNGTASGTADLPNIPRKAEITSAPNFNDEANPTISYSNKAGNSVTSLQARIENSAGSSTYVEYRDISKTGTSYTFNLTTAERNVLRSACSNSNSLTVKFVIKTVINGNTFWSTVDKTMSIVNGNPTFSSSQLSYIDSDSSIVAITENNQHIVRNQSNLKVTYTGATAKKGASISKYEITFNGVTQTKTAATTIDYGKVNLSSNATVSVKAIDSRGNSTTISKTIQIKDWVLPSATITAGRVNNYEDETRLKANVTISSVNSKNAIQSIQYRYKKSSESNYGSYVNMSNNVQSTLSLDKLYAWDFQIAIADKFGSTTYNFTIAKGMPIMFIDTKKLSVGINSFPASNNILNVDGEIRQNNIPISGGGSGITTTVAVGTTTTGAAGTQASVTNSGSNVNAVFDFVIPRGNKGDKGDTGYGVISGGTTGQVLAKKSNTNYDTEWITPVITETDPVFSASAASGITSSDISNWNSKSNFNGDYNSLTNKPSIPTVPTNLSSFVDDLGSSPVHTHSQYLTSHQDISGKVDKVAGKELSTNDFTNTYKDNVDSNTVARHTHNNKDLLDNISSTDISNWNNKSTFSGDYNDLTNKPTIPTNISAFTNDVGYITANDLIPFEIIQYYDTDEEIITKLNSCMDYNNAKLLKKPILLAPFGSGKQVYGELISVNYRTKSWTFKYCIPNAYNIAAQTVTTDLFPQAVKTIQYRINGNTLEKIEDYSDEIKQRILYSDSNIKKILVEEFLNNSSIFYPVNILFFEIDNINTSLIQWQYYKLDVSQNGSTMSYIFNFISGNNTKTMTMSIDDDGNVDATDYNNWTLTIDGVVV